MKAMKWKKKQYENQKWKCNNEEMAKKINNETIYIWK